MLFGGLQSESWWNGKELKQPSTTSAYLDAKDVTLDPGPFVNHIFNWNAKVFQGLG
jgi:hypothetical protein